MIKVLEALVKGEKWRVKCQTFLLRSTETISVLGIKTTQEKKKHVDSIRSLRFLIIISVPVCRSLWSVIKNITGGFTAAFAHHSYDGERQTVRSATIA